MTERAARVVLAAVVAFLVAGGLTAGIPQFWSDGATYHSMAWSLAEDFDLRYEARDILRVRREFPSGPQGLFLKRGSGGFEFDPEGGFPRLRRVPEADPRIYYAKAFIYPLAAAPLVMLVGTRGLLLTNALFLGIALVAAYTELRRGRGPGRALAVALVLCLGTVMPLYLLWPQPEVFNMGLVAAGLWAWRSERPLLSAALLGLATYSKPYNLFLALPLGLDPLVQGGASLSRRLLESLRRGAALAVAVAALFGLNKAVTGELNYQGGERKTFYGTFPFEAHDVTFGNSGQWMTTAKLGPLVEGRDEATRQAGPPRAPDEIRLSFLRNLAYFWIGRFGGAIPYFFPACLAVVLFLAWGPRDRAGWLALASLLASYLFYIAMIPDNWYGGGGTVGNRYFLNLLPLASFLVPRGRELPLVAAGSLVSALVLWPVLLHPMAHSLRPGDHAMGGAFRLFPPELTMLNDLSIFTEPWRKKRPFGDTEGDPHRNWPADPKAYYLYFLDDGTYGRESLGNAEGFWLRGGEPAEVVLRALEPVGRLHLRITGGPAGDEVAARAAGGWQSVTVRPGETVSWTLEPGPGFPYYDSFLHVLRFRSRRAGSEGQERSLGAFVSIGLEVRRREHRPR